MTEQELNAIKAAKITAPDMPISMNTATERMNELAVEWEEHPEHFEDVNPFFVAIHKIRDKSLEWKAEPLSVKYTTSTIRCPKCNKQITSRGSIHNEIKFCWKCGQEVKWE